MIPEDRLTRPGLKIFWRRTKERKNIPRQSPFNGLPAPKSDVGQFPATQVKGLSAKQGKNRTTPPNTHSGAGFRPQQLRIRTMLGTKVLLPRVTGSTF
jgi:hypothetical protein